MQQARHRGRGTARPLALLLCTLTLSACGTMQRTPAPPRHAIIPVPVHLAATGGRPFELRAGTPVVVGSAEEAEVGRYLAGLLEAAFGTPAPLRTAAETPETPQTGGIHLRLDAASDLPPEGYELVVAPARVTLTAREPAGLFYGVQTLRQLLPAESEAGKPIAGPVRLDALRIVDYPRFEWRGAMLDVSRHFFGVADVKRLIDLMALYKLNRLHLHLSDDQGWRVEIESWPNLTAHGGSTQVGGGAGGYYTQADYAEIVRYAQSRFVTVVPEFDMPGHTNAALASYAELNCDDVAPELYTGIKVGFSSLCPEKEVTYRFVDDVVREIAALTPGPYFHIGGDEVEKLTDEQYRAFIERVQVIVRSHGKWMIGWEEISPAKLAPGTVVQHWRSDVVREAVRQGNRVIMSPSTRAYLDMKYDSTTTLGLNWAGYIEVQHAYDWDPATQIEGVSERDILGVEAPLWTETVETMRDIEFMTFPRLAGYAEIGWSPAARRSWAEYRERLGEHTARWDALGVNYYRSPQLP